MKPLEPGRPTPIRDALIAAVRRRGLSGYALAKLSGIDAAAIRRFLAGERDLTLARADALFAALGLEVLAPGPDPKAPGRKP